MVKMGEIDLCLIPLGIEESRLMFLLRIINSIFEITKERIRNPMLYYPFTQLTKTRRKGPNKRDPSRGICVLQEQTKYAYNPKLVLPWMPPAMQDNIFQYLITIESEKENIRGLKSPFYLEQPCKIVKKPKTSNLIPQKPQKC